MPNSKLNFKPVGKYVNEGGKEGVRYIWEIDDAKDYYVESGAFYKRTILGVNKIDEQIAAYTTSVSSGCVLSLDNKQCKFCVTGNKIPFKRLLSAEEIALQNIFMTLDDDDANKLNKMREFAYMGQGEPGFSYEQVKKAIIITNSVMNELGIKVYRHIFATSGVTPAVKNLTTDVASGVYGNTKILLHLSVHSALQREKLMPIDEKFPLDNLIAASVEYSKVTGDKVVINLMMLGGIKFGEYGPFVTVSSDEVKYLVSLLNPKYHRIIICEYNQPSGNNENNGVNLEEIEKAEKTFLDNGFETKKFVAFGKRDKLACGLLGGMAMPNLNFSGIEEKFDRALELVSKYK